MNQVLQLEPRQSLTLEDVISSFFKGHYDQKTDICYSDIVYISARSIEDLQEKFNHMCCNFLISDIVSFSDFDGYKKQKTLYKGCLQKIKKEKFFEILILSRPIVQLLIGNGYDDYEQAYDNRIKVCEALFGEGKFLLHANDVSKQYIDLGFIVTSR